LLGELGEGKSRSLTDTELHSLGERLGYSH
jgi:hypothetical protein